MNQQVRVLIVDDESAILLALELALADTGWRIDTAGSAEDAMALAETRAWDVAIIDKNLPGRSGIELTGELRRRQPEVGVVIITGFSSAMSARDALNAEVDAYLEKPFADIYAITAVVRKALARRERRLEVPRRGKAMAAGGDPPALRVLAASASAALHGRLRGHLEAGDHLETTSGAGELLARVRAADPAPDLVVLDGADVDLGDALVRLRAAHERLPCVVVAKQLPVQLLRRLIDLELDLALEPLPATGRDERLLRLLTRQRERKLARPAAGG